MVSIAVCNLKFILRSHRNLIYFGLMVSAYRSLFTFRFWHLT